MKKFRIQYRRSGSVYGYEYRSSLAGVQKYIAETEWLLPTDPHHACKPQGATVWERTEWGGWEEVATVDRGIFNPVDWQLRRSVRDAQQEIERLTARIEAAKQLVEALSDLEAYPPTR